MARAPRGARRLAPPAKRARSRPRDAAEVARKPLERIGDFQARGWVRRDLDPEDVRRRLFSVVYAAVLAILAAPTLEEERRQLAEIDRVLGSIAADSGVEK